MKTGIYARISLDRKDDHQGVDRQLQDCRRKVRGTVEEFVDNSKSAWKEGTKRPRYEALLEEVREGNIDRIVVWHIDRLYRQMGELLVLCGLAQQGKVVVESVMGGDFDLTTADGAMRAQQMVMYATYESRHKSERIKAKQAQNRQEGKSSGGRFAFGWKDATTPDPTAAGKILQAVDLLMEGASLKDIAKKWNREGVKRPQNRESRWDANTIRLVVSNPRHAGLLAHDPKRGSKSYERTVVAKANWPAIIKREKWEALMAHLEARGRSHAVPRRRTMLTGLLVCGRCGTHMVRARVGAAVMYRCPSPRPEQPLDQKSCGGVSVDGKFLDPLLTEATFARADSDKLVGLLEGATTKEGQSTAKIIKEMQELEDRRDLFASMAAKGKLQVRDWDKARATIDSEQVVLRKKLQKATSTSVIAPFAGRKGALRADWDTLTTDQQREIIGSVLGKIKIMPTEMRGRHVFDKDRVRIA